MTYRLIREPDCLQGIVTGDEIGHALIDMKLTNAGVLMVFQQIIIFNVTETPISLGAILYFHKCTMHIISSCLCQTQTHGWWCTKPFSLALYHRL